MFIVRRRGSDRRPVLPGLRRAFGDGDTDDRGQRRRSHRAGAVGGRGSAGELSASTFGDGQPDLVGICRALGKQVPKRQCAYNNLEQVGFTGYQRR